jgi:alkanesulfonate monooxygenase SsuD/methylene tetrahydromethanopterin reductase-like flavin-dependent oxidoreductase (luciferase family)
MKFSLLMPGSMRQPMINHPFEACLGAADFRRIGATADDLGFDAISVPEHLVVPLSMTPTMDPHHWHALTGMGFLAGATRRCLVNSSVMLLPLHNPVELAKPVPTLDVLTDGRVMCTFGAGYTEGEFAAVGATSSSIRVLGDARPSGSAVTRPRCCVARRVSLTAGTRG